MDGDLYVSKEFTPHYFCYESRNKKLQLIFKMSDNIFHSNIFEPVFKIWTALQRGPTVLCLLHNYSDIFRQMLSETYKKYF